MLAKPRTVFHRAQPSVVSFAKKNRDAMLIVQSVVGKKKRKRKEKVKLKVKQMQK